MLKNREYIAVPPGASIREQLVDRNMSQKEFAVRMDLSEKHVSRLINGDVQLTPEMAERLEMVLGVPAAFWNNLEAIYREKLLKIEAEKSAGTDVEIVKRIPYEEMAGVGWIDKTVREQERLAILRKYFEVVRLELLDSPRIAHIACRRLQVTKKGDLAVLAWAQQAKLRARTIDTASFDLKKAEQVIPELPGHLTKKGFEGKIQKELASVGIALVYLKPLPNGFLRGVSFSDGSKAVIGLTPFDGNIEAFKSDLFHELGHVMLGHICKENGLTAADEKAADKWAASHIH